MEVTQKKAVLDDFARSLNGAVKKFACFGIYQKTNPCVYCKVLELCKAQTPRSVK